MSVSDLLRAVDASPILTDVEGDNPFRRSENETLEFFCRAEMIKLAVVLATDTKGDDQ